MLDSLSKTLHSIKAKAEKLPELIATGNIESSFPISQLLAEEVNKFTNDWLTDKKRLEKEGRDIQGLNDSET